jgi:hypothetical protein
MEREVERISQQYLTKPKPNLFTIMEALYPALR